MWLARHTTGRIALQHNQAHLNCRKIKTWSPWISLPPCLLLSELSCASAAQPWQPQGPKSLHALMQLLPLPPNRLHELRPRVRQISKDCGPSFMATTVFTFSSYNALRAASSSPSISSGVSATSTSLGRPWRTPILQGKVWRQSENCGQFTTLPRCFHHPGSTISPSLPPSLPLLASPPMLPLILPALPVGLTSSYPSCPALHRLVSRKRDQCPW